MFASPKFAIIIISLPAGNSQPNNNSYTIRKLQV